MQIESWILMCKANDIQFMEVVKLSFVWALRLSMRGNISSVNISSVQAMGCANSDLQTSCNVFESQTHSYYYPPTDIRRVSGCPGWLS
jgi:hypothetical protein